MTRVPVQRLFRLTSASAIGMAAAFALNIVLAKILSVEDFGVTRVVTAYLVVLSVIGQFALHDALSSSVARATGQKEVADLFVSASVMTISISVCVTILAIQMLGATGYASTELVNTIATISPVIPLVGLTQVYSSALQAVGGYRGVVYTQIANGFVPLAVIIPASVVWALPGWLGSRVASGALLLGVVVMFVRPYFVSGRLNRIAVSKLWVFSRIQIVSSILSLVLMSGDVIILERVSRDMNMVANYALGSLIVRSFGFIPTAIGRAYFVNVASSDAVGVMARRAFLGVNIAVGIVLAAVTALVGPYIIVWFLGDSYELAGDVMIIWSLAVVALFHWQGVSIINVAKGMPGRSVVISFVGALIGLPLLFTWGASSGAVGAAWACVAAYTAGAVVGTWNLRADGLLTARSVVI